MNTIHAVIFDLGRVLVNVVPTGEKFGRLMRALGVPPDQAFNRFWRTREVEQHMTGGIDSREFYRLARERFGFADGYDEFVDGWCDIFAPMPGMAELFDEVAKRHPIGLLSDTDPLHWGWLRDMLPWLKRVERPTLSYEVGSLKPDPAMYAAAADNVGYGAGECLFIDDLPGNVEGAERCGMRAVRFAGAEKVRKDLEALGLL